MIGLNLRFSVMTPNSCSSQISGDELSELKRYVLEASRKILVENVDAPRFLPYFRSKFLLDQRECDQIKSCSRQSRYDGAEKLLDVLITKGGSGYDHFCAAIMYDRTQMFLLTTLNKRLEILRDWRKNQVAEDQRIRQAQEELMRQRVQAQANRQQQVFNMYPNNGRNRTYPLMTASYTGQRYPSQPGPPAQARIHVPASYHQHNPERLARSPLPPEEMEPMAPSNSRFPPHPYLNQPGDCYPPQFIEPQQQHHEAHLLQHNRSQQVYLHPSVHPSAAQPPLSEQAPGESSNPAGYPPQPMLQGQQYSGYVPPPAPVEAVYPVPIEGGGMYYEHQNPPAPHHHHEVLTLNTPTGAMMENLLPGMPPPATGSANTSYTSAADPQAMLPATSSNHYHEPETGEAESHQLLGSSPQYPHSYGLLSSTAAAGYGTSSKDILCGQGGN